MPEPSRFTTKNLPAQTKNVLAYHGMPIADRGETLSLTDMWKAAGSPANQDPAQWSRSAGAEAFIEAVSVNMGIPHNDLIQTVRGGKTPGTWAHWQVAFAYAKYLSPDFHMWCNNVVRAYMEGKTHSVVDFTDYRAAREHRLQFAQNLKMAALIGLKGPEAAIAANQATTRATGFDTLEAMGVKHIMAPQNDVLIVPSDIGKELGMSAAEVNSLLERYGLQEHKRTKKGRGYWVPTPKGEGHGGTMVVVQRAHDVTGSARQLKWPTNIIGVLRDLMSGRAA